MVTINGRRKICHNSRKDRIEADWPLDTGEVLGLMVELTPRFHLGGGKLIQILEDRRITETNESVNMKMRHNENKKGKVKKR